MTRKLAINELIQISAGINGTNCTNTTNSTNTTNIAHGGYTPPYNPDTEPFRAGVANLGGYANNYIREYTGIDLTGDDITYNKALAAFIYAGFLVGTFGLLRAKGWLK